MEPVQPQNPQPPPPTTFNPQPTNTLQEPVAESLPQDQPVSPKRFKFKVLLISAVSLLLILTLSSGYFFWWVPEAAAKEFIEKTSADFFEINGKVDVVFSNFQKIKEESATVETAFTEITNMTNDYYYTKKDTQEDIDQISAVLPKIKEAKTKIETLEKPQKVEKLANALLDYYSNLEETFESLLLHEQIQLKEIDAHGQALYDLIKKVIEMEKTGDVNRQEYISVLTQISQEASAAKLRTEQITPVSGEDEIDIAGTQARIEFFRDTSVSYSQAASLIARGQDQTGLQVLIDMGTRVRKLNDGTKELAKKYVVESKPAIGFAKLPDLEAKVLEEFKNLDVDISIPSPTPEQESTPSAQPATSSAQPLQSTSSATPSLTSNP